MRIWETCQMALPTFKTHIVILSKETNSIKARAASQWSRMFGCYKANPTLDQLVVIDSGHVVNAEAFANGHCGFVSWRHACFSHYVTVQWPLSSTRIVVQFLYCKCNSCYLTYWDQILESPPPVPPRGKLLPSTSCSEQSAKYYHIFLFFDTFYKYRPVSTAGLHVLLIELRKNTCPRLKDCEYFTLIILGNLISYVVREEFSKHNFLPA